MNIKIDRKYKKLGYTISNLYIDGVWFCNALEDTDRGLRQTMPVEEIRQKKIYGMTAIPSGRYIVRMDIVSPKYSQYDWYKKNFQGRMPRLENVKGFEGILIHCGNTALDSYGCILVGVNKQKGKVLESRDTFLKLWKILDAAYRRKETIYLEIM